MELLNQYYVIQNLYVDEGVLGQIPIPIPIPMGQFYAAAADALLGPNTTTTSSIRMPIEWQSISVQDQDTLLDLLIAALTPQTAKVLAPQGRFQDSTRLYTVRIFLRIKPENPACPTQLVWSQPSDPFRIAAWYESGGRPHPPIVLPDPSNLRAIAKPNASFAVPASLMNAMQGSSLSGMLKGSGGGGGHHHRLDLRLQHPADYHLRLLRAQYFLFAASHRFLLAAVFQDLHTDSGTETEPGRPMMAASNYIDPVSWPYLPLPQNGQLVFPTLEQSVRDSIRIILTTRPGEQLMRPRFGAGLQNFLEDGNTISVRRQIQSVDSGQPAGI